MFEWIKTLFEQYSYLVLFISLLLELIALPLPGEALMGYAGFLVYQGQLHWSFSIFMAAMGAITGMTISYWIGRRLGTPFFKMYGHYIHLGPERLEKVSLWFDRYGNKLLVIAYFIPGVRHITGYFSGTARISYRVYMVYAYLGAFIWVSTFISLGKILGPQWEQFHTSIKKYLIIAGIIAIILLAIFYLYRTYRSWLKERLEINFKKALDTFPTLGRIKILIASAGIVFIGFFALMLGMIQDFLAQEFDQFNNITTLVVKLLFDQSWQPWMQIFQHLSTIFILLPLILFTWLWIMLRSPDRKLESIFLFLVVVGGEILNEGLRFLFHHTFPSEQSLTAIVVFGFTAYLLVRHIKGVWVHNLAIFLVLSFSFLIGISQIYFGMQYPSDIVAGYVFGGVWLSLQVFLLEIFRLFPKINY
ncbi:MAG: VTT domain-containing protein [Tepidibacillus sp.]